MSDPTDNLQSASSLYYLPGRWYSFTICPRDQLETNCNRWQAMCTRIYECVISSFTNHAQYRYNLEISEPHNTLKETTIPRIHAHGRFLLYDNHSVLQFLLFGLYNLTQLGYTEIDTIKDLDIWDTYCTKQLAITRLETIISTHSAPPTKKKDRKPIEPYNKKQIKQTQALDWWIPPPPPK